MLVPFSGDFKYILLCSLSNRSDSLCRFLVKNSFRRTFSLPDESMLCEELSFEPLKCFVISGPALLVIWTICQTSSTFRPLLMIWATLKLPKWHKLFTPIKRNFSTIPFLILGGESSFPEFSSQIPSGDSPRFEPNSSCSWRWRIKNILVKLNGWIAANSPSNSTEFDSRCLMKV